ncbi:hypothetical protein P7K49_000958 [Saguinus oedipus]|uniref:Small ribosomal subunit protein RACK1 n=1 Tax=Saguinus oedipus TaxID=9490 RepID=A0ABQ9WGV9_SAGOE|nr:hypothetical protein P7K49_000958 [Saguinus oedipus]
MTEQMTLRGTLKGHNGWVTQIATTPQFPDMILSASRDKIIVMWKLTRDETNYGIPQHGQFALSGSWDGTLCLWDLTAGTTTSKDGQAMLWDLNEGKHLYTLDGGDIINVLCFSPKHYWLCAATGPSIKIWDLEGKIIVDELKQEVISTSSQAERPQCTSLAWSADGQTLFAGYTDNLGQVWQVTIGTR